MPTPKKMNGKHRMNGHMMDDDEMEKMMKKRGMPKKKKEITFKHPGHLNQAIHAGKRAARAVGARIKKGAEEDLLFQGGKLAARGAAKLGRAAYRRSTFRPVVGAAKISARAGRKVGGKIVGRVKRNLSKPGGWKRGLTPGLRIGMAAGKLAFRRVGKEIAASLFVFKEAEDYRWVLLSSNGFRDKDGEIVSTKALQHDVAMWDLEGQPRTPLRWWHVSLDDEHHKGLELGYTDFRMVEGHTLIESGKFISPTVGEAVFKARDGLAASIGFRHPSSEPDRDKIFHTIRSFERSLLPKESASNLLTHLSVV